MSIYTNLYYKVGVSFTLGMLSISSSAHAGGGGGGGADGSSANTIAETLTDSISQLPSLISALSYLAGITLGTLGVLKVKDHVENPQQTPLKEGAIRLATGGALLALPTIFSAMVTAIGDTPTEVVTPGVADIMFGT